MKEAPLFVDAYDLTSWVLGRMAAKQEDSSALLRARVANTCLDLLDSVTLALKGYDTHDKVERADEAVALLRVQLRLAMDLECLERRQFLHAVERLDAIGRQIGGWLKRLRSV